MLRLEHLKPLTTSFPGFGAVCFHGPNEVALLGIIEGVRSVDDSIEVENDEVGHQADGGDGGDEWGAVGGNREERLQDGKYKL